MNARIDQLVRTLLQKDTLEQCSLGELRDYASRFPYFGAAQLLLTKKLQSENSEEYTEHLKRTYSFFHNPLWVETILEDKGNAAIEMAEIVTNQENEPEPIETIPALEVKTIGLEPMPLSSSKEELLFEPFHTVDYFASQGIKLKEEEKPQDKFGQQLLSFTEWLKTLRKTPPSEAGTQVPALAEKKVEELAETSLSEKQVVTEAMAEVWEKQGNHSKAIDIYQKLSLLEPAKSAYFAAKIDALKK
ncbi:MAG: hypothetical protein IPQ08_03605 [Chitinophagaceae bacterium]|nr:hypothetical protein [Chitinophagaceae bacterium]